MARIDRDKYGVPHIYGDNLADVYFGYGYAVASDRLFQLEMRRRQATGQLAEVLGPGVRPSANPDNPPKVGTPPSKDNVISLDAKMRRDYDPADLMAQFKSLTTDEQGMIHGYTDGINARIDEINNKQAPLPVQFTEVWGQDTLQAVRLNAWTLQDTLAAATNALCSFCGFSGTESNARLLSFLQATHKDNYQRIFDTLLWTNDPYAPTTKNDAPLLEVPPPSETPKLTQQPVSGAIPHVVVLPPDTSEDPYDELLGLTSMAILTRPKNGGSAIQLNGPQPGWNLPGYFYTVGLHVDKLNYHVVGHAPGGLLAITTGDNGHIAWGSTSAGGDHTIIYEERMSPDGTAYQCMGKAHPTSPPRVETVKVKGGTPQKFTYHYTHRGPFITDIKGPGPVYSKQVLWKGVELKAVMAWVRAAQTTNWADFLEQGKKMAMGYNWFYSDVEGNIGWLFGGFFPVGVPASAMPDPRLPAKGEVLYSVMGESLAGSINSLNPPEGYIVNWNNKPVMGYPNKDLQTPRWSQGDRVNILADLMRNHPADKLSGRTFTENDVHTIYQQATTTDVNFYHFGPLLRLITSGDAQKCGVDATTEKALQALQRWDGRRVPGDAQNATYAGCALPIFKEWLEQLVKMTIGPVFGDMAKLDPVMRTIARSYVGTLQLPIMKNSVNLAMGTKIVLRALQADLNLRAKNEMGYDSQPPYNVLQPAYSGLKSTDPKHVMLAALAVALKTLASEAKGAPADFEAWRLPMVKQFFFAENAEGMPTAAYTEKPSFPVSANRGAMQRIALSTGNQIQSSDANPPGQSADPGSPHYGDQLALYGNWGFKPLPLHPACDPKLSVTKMPKVPSKM